MIACSSARHAGSDRGSKLKNIGEKAGSTTRELADPQPKKTSQDQTQKEVEKEQHAAETNSQESATIEQAPNPLSPCEILKEIKLSGDPQSLKLQACTSGQLSKLAKEKANSPLIPQMINLIQGVHYSAIELGSDTKFNVHLAARYPTSCSRMVHEVGDKVVLLPKRIGTRLIEVNQSTSKIQDIASQGNTHIKGAVYQVEDRVSATVVRSQDSYQFVINVYGDAPNKNFVSIEETIKSGKNMKNRSTISLLQTNKQNQCDVLIFSEMTADNSDWHEMLVDDFMVPALKNSIELGLNSALQSP